MANSKAKKVGFTIVTPFEHRGVTYKPGAEDEALEALDLRMIHSLAALGNIQIQQPQRKPAPKTE